MTTTNTFNASGDPTEIFVRTTGTGAGIGQVFEKTITNQYLTNNTTGDNWILGRLQRATVRNVVPNSLDSIATGYGASANANATAGTLPALGVAVSPSSASASQAAPGTVSSSTTITVSGSPSLPLSYSWARLSGATALVVASSANGSTSSTSWGTTFSANLTYGQSASETWRLTVTDAIGRTGTINVPVTLTVTTQVLTVGVSPANSSASRNNPGAVSVTATTTTAGGAAPLSYSWTRITGSRISVSNNTSATATFSATLGWAENLSEQFRVTVTDSVGQAVTATTTVTFTSPAAPALSISPTALTISAASPGTASGSVTGSGSGGVAPYTYTWSRLTGSRIGVSGGQTGNFSANVNWADNFTESFQLTLTDAAGNTAASSINVTAVGPTPPPQATVTISPTSISRTVNDTTLASSSATAGVVDGVAPFSYAWTVVSTGGASAAYVTNATSATATLNVRPLQCEFHVAVFRVSVTDAIGRVTTKDINMTVRSRAYKYVCP